MEPHPFTLLFALLLLTATTSAAPAVSMGRRTATLLGSYRPITNLNDPHVVEIARFAVSEHNKRDGSKLEFVSVVNGESQVVAGINYRLVVAAKDGVVDEKYEAVVYEKPWERFRSLSSFKPV